MLSGVRSAKLLGESRRSTEFWCSSDDVRLRRGGRHAAVRGCRHAVLPGRRMRQDRRVAGGTEMCMPGDNTSMVVELVAPIAMDEGLRFAIREGGRTVGAGRVTKIIK
ncbi:MAG: hypothetical protein R2699_02685 [Acidimicrobiales bacterium]